MNDLRSNRSVFTYNDICWVLLSLEVEGALIKATFRLSTHFYRKSEASDILHSLSRNLF
jgi:hypothetical protein